MSLEDMKRRVNYLGGADQQDRMIEDKLRSMLSATEYSYQAAKFNKYPEYNAEVKGLFNANSQNENSDTKNISTSWLNEYKVGDIFKWQNTDTLWIIFLQDKTELAYFRGECRRCDYKIQWVNKDRELIETVVSIIGPSVAQLKTSASMQSNIAEDFPNANLKILVSDNEQNQLYFNRYQTFLLKGTNYQIEEIDNISMPGIIQLQATEYYTNLIEDDVEENIHNAWNIQPVLEESTTDYAIEGPDTVKPQYKAEFEAIMSGGEWVIVENLDVPSKDYIPAKFVELDVYVKVIHVYWDSTLSGQYTLGYLMPNGVLYQKHILVESLM